MSPLPGFPPTGTLRYNPRSAAAAALAATAAARVQARERARSFLSVETAFVSVMHLRDRYMALRASGHPDASAKEETMLMAAAGREHPAIRAFQSNRYAPAFYLTMPVALQILDHL